MSIESILKTTNAKIHFIGIGGVSMSSLAKLLSRDGHQITGSDTTCSDNVKCLQDAGINVFHTHSASNIKNYDMVVYTAAIDKDNEELKAAYAAQIPTIERACLLGEMMKQYRYPLNIAGTHGKTTTTSMLSSIFIHGGKNPTITVGGNLNIINGNLNIGGKDYFICEACEYVESFLKFYPYASVILNIEEDHLDYFKDIAHIKESFLKFAERTDPEGFVILNGDDKNCMDIKNHISCDVYTFGMGVESTVCAKNIEYDSLGYPHFDLHAFGSVQGRIALSVRGEHNIYNALASALLALLADIPFSDISKGLMEFTGAERRFEYKGEFNGAKIYDDYAHHPTEIKSTIESIKRMEFNSLYLVFQPHTYSRTHALMDDFADVLSNVGNVIITDIYAAREKNKFGISSKQLADKIESSVFISDFDDIADYLKERIKPGDLVFTVGAGNVVDIGKRLI